jgi:uncharacterized protein (TIGR03083 family)
MILSRFGKERGMADIWTRIHEERAALAEILPKLTERQWATESLCEGWSVRNVVAHVISSYERETLSFAAGLARHGFNVHRYNQSLVERIGAVSDKTLVARYNSTVNLRNKLPVPDQFVLAETLIHNEDIFRSLDCRRIVPIETALIVAQLLRSTGAARKWRRDNHYVKLVANDADWSYGEGDVASGPLLSIVMLLAGRAAVADDFEGDGARRIGSQASVS